jgi:hypothetical protein
MMRAGVVVSQPLVGGAPFTGAGAGLGLGLVDGPGKGARPAGIAGGRAGDGDGGVPVLVHVSGPVVELGPGASACPCKRSVL